MALDNLVDPQGRPILLQGKPNLCAPGVFEGLVNFKLYIDAIEGEGKCIHCGGVVKELVRLPPSDEIKTSEPERDRQAKIDSARQALFDAIKGHHFCPVLHADKLDSDDWLKRFN